MVLQNAIQSSQNSADDDENYKPESGSSGANPKQMAPDGDWSSTLQKLQEQARFNAQVPTYIIS